MVVPDIGATARLLQPEIRGEVTSIFTTPEGVLKVRLSYTQDGEPRERDFLPTELEVVS